MSEREFERYLRLLEQLLGLEEDQREAVRDELRDHMEERLYELMNKGFTRDEAVQIALDEFGDAAGLAGSLTRVGRVKLIRRRIMQSSIGTLAAAAGLVLVVTLLLPEHRPGVPSVAESQAESEPPRETPGVAPTPNYGGALGGGGGSSTGYPGGAASAGSPGGGGGSSARYPDGLASPGRAGDGGWASGMGGGRRSGSASYGGSSGAPGGGGMAMGTGASSRSAPVDDARQKLQERVDAVFEDKPLEQVFQWLREQTGANVFVNWQVLRDRGVERDRPVTLDLRDVSAETVLTFVLEDVGAALGGLGHTVHDNVVHVGDGRPREAELRVYDVEPLISEAAEPERNKARGELLELVEAHLLHGGQATDLSLSLFDDLLFVQGSERQHRDAERLLKMVRQARAERGEGRGQEANGQASLEERLLSQAERLHEKEMALYSSREPAPEGTVQDMREIKAEMANLRSQLWLPAEARQAWAEAERADPQVPALRQELQRLQNERRRKASRYGPEHREVRSVEAKLEQLQAELEARQRDMAAGRAAEARRFEGGEQDQSPLRRRGAGGGYGSSGGNFGGGSGLPSNSSRSRGGASGAR